ncbi:MAG: phage portal protein [Phycisphaerales bacterium]|nr:phage portal protein [Phycisphaerales bacterium]
MTAAAHATSTSSHAAARAGVSRLAPTDPLRLAAQAGVEPDDIRAAAEHLSRHVQPRMAMFWEYYRNTLSLGAGVGAGRSYRLGQERGLPLRITSPASVGVENDDRVNRREPVVENDIAWRVGAMIDFLFGRPVRMISTASDAPTARKIEAALEEVWEASGGLGLLQEAALLAHVFGHVDFEVQRIDEPGEQVTEAGHCVRIVLLDPRQAVPLTDGSRTEPRAAVQRMRVNGPSGQVWQTRVIGPLASVDIIEEPAHASGSEPAGRVVSSICNRVAPGRAPVVHVVNAPLPLSWMGLGEVEPLIPLQDELNTRLSDRAYRVTLQSFKMYLVKGLGVSLGGGSTPETRPVGPGIIWSTENPDAQIEAFGGDASSPSEESHINELREAMDKISGVPPLATGVVQGRVGNLSSENALRLTLQGLLARTARKRLAYGRGIAQVCELILSALHEAGVLSTTARQRGVRLEWPELLTGDGGEQLRAAREKIDLGVPRDTVLTELGYVPPGREGASADSRGALAQ